MPPFLRVAMLAHFDFRMVDEGERIGAGKGLTDADAIASAIGEATERYCAYQWDEARTWVAPWADVSEAAISPTDLVLYSAEQYARPQWPYTPWDETTHTSWIKGVALPSGRPLAVPASLTYLVHPPARREDHFTSPTSNGLAAGETPDHARLGALCEVMERDAFLIAWMNRLPATELDLFAVDDVAANIVRRYRRGSVTVRAYVLPSDLPATTILAIAFDDGVGRPAQVVALGCHPSPQVALRKALFELCQARPSESRRFRDASPIGRLERYTDVVTLDDHSALASHPQRRHEFDFLAAGEPVRIADLPDRSLGEPGADVERCSRGTGRARPSGRRRRPHAARRRRLRPAHRPGPRDPTPTHPFRARQGAARGPPAVRESPRWGLADRVRTSVDLNPCPHPLA